MNAGGRHGLAPARDALGRLVARTAIHDRAAFRALFELTRAHVFGVCVKMLRNRNEAEEAFQDVYVNVWRFAATFAGGDPAQPMAWIHSITRNRCLEILRRRGVDDAQWDTEAADAIPDEGPSPEQHSIRSEAARDVVDCLKTLDAAQQQAIELAYYEGLSHGEVAARLGRPLGTVKSHIRRGLVRLKRCLQRS